MSELRLILPMPPSANRIWRMMRGHMAKSDFYREWKEMAADSVSHQLGGQAPIGWFSIAFTVPVTRRDPDNCIKPALDALQHGGAIRNDSMLRGLTFDVDDDQPEEWVSVGIFAAPAPKLVQEREAQAFLAIDAARVLLSDYREHLTPHTMERALRVSKLDPDKLNPAMAASMCRLADRVMGRRN